MKLPLLSCLAAAMAFMLLGCSPSGEGDGEAAAPGGGSGTEAAAPGGEGATQAPAMATVAEAEAEYPLTTCVVSGEALGSMGEPVALDHEGTTVKLCCNGCREDFDADPAKYVAKLDSSTETE